MDDELVQLASVYEAPGFLLLAVDDDGERLGCVGVRALSDSDGRCEMRRMFVRSQGRGLGLGRSLADRLVAQATAAGFEQIVLNTMPAMTEAVALYESMGFSLIDPYVDEPLDDILYYGLALG